MICQVCLLSKDNFVPALARKGTIRCRQCHNKIRNEQRKRARQRQFDKLVEILGPTCGICKRRQASVIDHDHATGCVRGILCNRCNNIIGFYKDEIAVFVRVIQYLEVPKDLGKYWDRPLRKRKV